MDVLTTINAWVAAIAGDDVRSWGDVLTPSVLYLQKHVDGTFGPGYLDETMCAHDIWPGHRPGTYVSCESLTVYVKDVIRSRAISEWLHDRMGYQQRAVHRVHPGQYDIVMSRSARSDDAISQSTVVIWVRPHYPGTPCGSVVANEVEISRVAADHTPLRTIDRGSNITRVSYVAPEGL